MNAPAAIPSPKAEADRRSDADRHEPSMDEILASIRRIISEDQGQMVAKAAEAAVNPLPPPPPPLTESVITRRPTSPADLGNAVERLRRALEPSIEKAPENAFAPPEPKPFFPPPPVRPVIPPVRTEDKSMPAAIPVQPPVAEPPPDVAPPVAVAMEDIESAAPEIHVVAEENIASAPVQPPVSPFPSLERAFPAAASVLERVAAMPSPAPVEPEAQSPASDAFQARAIAADALLSPTADASIASSFQTLATTMLFQDKSLMEDMVREMLRPMLKNWLDDNLPVMVERLVRAEIERVARGGRA